MKTLCLCLCFALLAWPICSFEQDVAKTPALLRRTADGKLTLELNFNQVPELTNIASLVSKSESALLAHSTKGDITHILCLLQKKMIGTLPMGRVKSLVYDDAGRLYGINTTDHLIMVLSNPQGKAVHKTKYPERGKTYNKEESATIQAGAAQGIAINPVTKNIGVVVPSTGPLAVGYIPTGDPIQLGYKAPVPYTESPTIPQAPAISIERIRADVKYLASDLLQGRGVGTRGEELATDYLASQFQQAGLKPAGENGSYFQKVPLVIVRTSDDATLVMKQGTSAMPLKLDEEFVGVSYSQQAEDFETDAIFMGHGISAPEFGWDDYASTDVRGKVVVLFTNEPPSDDPAFFAGKSLTYYGRWTYKYEEATRRGAKAVFIIHTPETAGYPYSVVRTVKGAQLVREPNETALAFAGWLSSQAGEKVLGAAGLTVAEAIKQADTKGFKPIPLGIRLQGHIPTKVQKIVSKNVAALVEGSDPTLKAEVVLFTAHWDHLGTVRSSVGVEEIHSGAQDNGTGCAILLETARAWSAMKDKPKRSALFLATTAEESGLLGAVYYAGHPLIPLGKTAMDFNFDMISPIGEPEAIVLNGAERTTAWGTLQAAATRNGFKVEGDPRAHLGHFYRSDHFALARGGVPAFSVARGERVKGQPADFTKKIMEDFVANVYHTPKDKYHEEWDFAGYPALIRFALDAAREVANANTLPTWNAGDEFRAARERSGVK